MISVVPEEADRRGQSEGLSPSGGRGRSFLLARLRRGGRLLAPGAGLLGHVAALRPLVAPHVPPGAIVVGRRPAAPTAHVAAAAAVAEAATVAVAIAKAAITVPVAEAPAAVAISVPVTEASVAVTIAEATATALAVTVEATVARAIPVEAAAATLAVTRSFTGRRSFTTLRGLAGRLLVLGSPVATLAKPGCKQQQIQSESVQRWDWTQLRGGRPAAQRTGSPGLAGGGRVSRSAVSAPGRVLVPTVTPPVVAAVVPAIIPAVVRALLATFIATAVTTEKGASQ